MVGCGWEGGARPRYVPERLRSGFVYLVAL